MHWEEDLVLPHAEAGLGHLKSDLLDPVGVWMGGDLKHLGQSRSNVIFDMTWGCSRRPKWLTLSNLWNCSFCSGLNEGEPQSRFRSKMGLASTLSYF